MTEPCLSIIAAMDRNRLIGSHNRLPWNIPEDLAHFRSITLEHTIIMGKNTWLSLGRTLDQRTNIILSRDMSLSIPGAIVCHSIPESLENCSENECFVIGGAQIFDVYLPIASKLYITSIDAEFSGDTYFPDFDHKLWETTYFEAISSISGYQLAFTEYFRKTSKFPKLA